MPRNFNAATMLEALDRLARAVRPRTMRRPSRTASQRPPAGSRVQSQAEALTSAGRTGTPRP